MIFCRSSRGARPGLAGREEGREAGRPVLFGEHARVADALLAITDAKAQRAKSGVVKGTYEKLRGSAKKNVEAAVPRLGEMVQKYAP